MKLCIKLAKITLYSLFPIDYQAVDLRIRLLFLIVE